MKDLEYELGKVRDNKHSRLVKGMEIKCWYRIHRNVAIPSLRAFLMGSLMVIGRELSPACSCKSERGGTSFKTPITVAVSKHLMEWGTQG